MSLLSDRDIKTALASGELKITPLDEARVEPCSIDLTLAPEYRRIRPEITHIDLADVPAGHTELHVAGDDGIRLEPGECVLMSTAETVTLGDAIAGQVDGKSSLGRLFQSVHITAGWVDAGWAGRITLEVVNHAPFAVTYRPGMPICQLVLFGLAAPVENPYRKRGRYQGQQGPTESRYGWTREAVLAERAAAVPSEPANDVAPRAANAAFA